MTPLASCGVTAVDFFSASRVLIVAGKGGVGKTTVGATVGIAAAQAGLRTHVVELEGRSNLGIPFGVDELTHKPTTLIEASEDTATLRGSRLTPDQALGDYLVDHGLRIGGRLAKFSAIELVTTTAPGIRDLLTLGKIRSLEENDKDDLIVVDAPAAGHAISFLRSAAGMASSAPSGPIRDQADLALAMLASAERCRVMLVTLPEETPVTEIIETAATVKNDVGVHLAPVVINSVWPQIKGLEKAAQETGKRTSDARDNRRTAASYRLARQHQQRSEIERLEAGLPLPQIELPFVFTTDLGRADLDGLAETLVQQVEHL